MTVNIVLLKNFNNYFNRLVRYKETLSGYAEISDSFIIPSGNFNPNDGVTATHIVGSEKNKFEEEWNPDYCLIVNPTTSEIISRWFVIEFRRTMINQYEMTLKRDSIADNLTLVKNAPFYCEKGYLKDNDVQVVNNEGIQFNQIKSAEYYLKDETKIPWIVAYVKQKRETDYSGDNKIQADCYDFIESTDVTDNEDFKKIFPNASTGTLETNKKVFHNDETFSFEICYIVKLGLAWYRKKVLKSTWNNGIQLFFDAVSIDSSPIDGFDRSAAINLVSHDYLYDGHEELKNIFNNFMTNIKSDFNSFINPYYSSKGCTDYSSNFDLKHEQFLNKILKLKVNGVYKYFKLQYQTNDEKIEKEFTNSNIMNDNFNNQFNKVKTGDWNSNLQSVDTKGIRFSCLISNKNYKLTELLSTKIYTELPKEAYQTQGVPYDVIAFPMFDTKMKNYTTNDIECNGSAGINIVRAMAKAMGDFFIDAQILPYCPFPECLTDGYIDYSKTHKSPVGSILVKEVEDTSKIISIGIIATYPMRHLEIENLGTSIYNDNEISCSDLLTVVDRKIESNTDLYRLCSPNYASMFDFNVAKCTPLQSGSVVAMTKFKVDITFRPYNPYIHVFPDYAFLYGQDYEDSRGLICSGDFGITTLSNAWINYMNNNKNFQNSFDRQINHLETERGLARERENLSLINAGIGAGFASGAGIIGGAMKGGIGGAVLGGVMGSIGGAMKIGNTILNNKINEEQYKENVKFSIDMFNMQMDNIKAMPESITHSSNLNNNFKFYPILEFYTCSETEKQALKSKIKYNGMTVGRIGSISEFLNSEDETFIKGQMIRLNFLSDDSHIANDIYNEVNNGLFFEKEEE